MRSFKTKWFTRWADEVGLEEGMLFKALDEIKAGLVDASLGGNVFKKRVAKSWLSKARTKPFLYTVSPKTNVRISQQKSCSC